MSCADRQNLYWVVMGASIPTGAWSGLDESSVRRTRTLRRIEERPCSPCRVFSTPHGRARIREAVSSPQNLGQSPKSTLRSGGSLGGTTSQQERNPAGVGPNPFLNCPRPLNGVGDASPGTTPDASGEWSAGRG